MAPDNTCLLCRNKPKRANYTFCSADCSSKAASRAPELLRIPSNHVMYKNVADNFRNHWDDTSRSPPKIVAMYLFTWTDTDRVLFDQWRDIVESSGGFCRFGLPIGNERKLFRSEKRACNLGDPVGGKTPAVISSSSLCSLSDCHLCPAIRTSFSSTIQHKLRLSGHTGCRLGRGVYSTPTSSKAFDYAVNSRSQSEYKAMLCTRVILGNVYRAAGESHHIVAPPYGFDSVEGVPGWGSTFEDNEFVVYHRNAIRPAYLLILK